MWGEGGGEPAAANEGGRRDALGLGGGALASCYISNEEQHDTPSQWSEWLRTHPSTDRRIARLEQLSATKGEQFRV